MTIYQEEMRRKANHHECEATYDETTGRLRITYDGQHLMGMDERGYLYYTFEALGEHFADINEGRFVCEGFIYNNSDMPLRDILSQNDTIQMGGM